MIASTSTSLCNYLEESAARFPQRLAVADPDGELTYAELNRRADGVAAYLAEHGVQAGDRVGIVMPKSTVSYTLLWGVLKAGAAYVPLDWTNPPERIAQILLNCEVRAVFVDPQCADLTGAAELLVSVDAATFDAMSAHEPIDGTMIERKADDLAFILYTSGSSGVPKGVMTTHGNVLSLVDWGADVFGGSEEDRYGNHAPIHFALSVLDLFTPIKFGASLFLVPTELGKDPRQLAAFIADRRLSVWFSTPAVLRLMAEFGNLDQLDFSSLRMVRFAGEAFQIPGLRRLVELWPTATFFNVWGSTETNVCTYTAIPKPLPPDRVDPYPIGIAGYHCRIEVLDEEGHPLPLGEEGLMHIAGPTVFPGYWGQAATNFVLRDGERFHNTGDVVRELPGEGFVYLGRRDRMIKRSGFRIELAELERTLLWHPAIAEAAVVAQPDMRLGMKITAHLVTRDSQRPSIIEMKAFCHERLPSYMNPDVFVFIEAMPRTSTNKVDYQSLLRATQGER